MSAQVIPFPLWRRLAVRNRIRLVRSSSTTTAHSAPVVSLQGAAANRDGNHG